ncbi:MAG: TolC family protein [Firmicutes bacterium]|nr:TolC family protein [Bacillota bacterium]MDH7496199.1 TolC family protein [Bacillota bacterium]
MTTNARTTERIHPRRAKLWAVAVAASVSVLAIATVCPRGLEATDATPSPPVRLTLAEALDLAAKQNPDVVTSSQALEVARSKFRESGGSRQPKIVLQGSHYATTYHTSDSGPGGSSGGSGGSGGTGSSGGSTSATDSSVRLTVSQTLPGLLPPPFSVGLSPAELAAVDVRQAELDAERTKQNVTYSVISAYLNVLRAQQIKALSDGAVEAATRLVHEGRTKLTLGVATALDLMKAESQLNQARFNQAKAADDVMASMRSLALLLGLPADTTFALVDDIQDREIDQNRDLEELVGLALENRTEIKQASLLVERARASVDTARRALWPSVGVSTTYSREGDVSVSATGTLGLTSGQAGWTLTLGSEESTGSRDELGGYGSGGAAASEPTSVTRVGIEVSWPLWDGGVSRERLAQAQTSLEMQRSALERQRQAIEEDVYAAVVSLKQAFLRHELAKSTVSEAEETLRITKARFEAGVAVMAEVIEATQSLDNAKSGQVQALFDCYLAWARLGKAVGLLGREGWRL